MSNVTAVAADGVPVFDPERRLIYVPEEGEPHGRKTVRIFHPGNPLSEVFLYLAIRKIAREGQVASGTKADGSATLLVNHRCVSGLHLPELRAGRPREQDILVSLEGLAPRFLPELLRAALGDEIWHEVLLRLLSGALYSAK